jgi:photosystem II stability/assembly factor-like uncharacterized protein
MRTILIAPLCLAAMLIACSNPPSAVVDTATLSESPSLRGLSRVDSQAAWVSGSAGTVARSLNSGQSWELLHVPGTADLDFRDVHAFNGSSAILMSAGPGDASRLYRTEDSGASWQLIATNHEPLGFWDGIAFWDNHYGLLVGDPVQGCLTVMTTEDGGRSWSTVPNTALPAAVDGEFAFAASGTSVAVQPGGLAWIATGGSVARVYRSSDYGRSWIAVETPVQAGSEGAGVFSIAFRDPQHGIVVGGDYLKPNQREANAAFTQDGGLTWLPVRLGHEPGGYRSGCSWFARQRTWIAVGPSGADFSTDDGRTWAPMISPGFHSIDQEWASGWNGRVGRAQ